MVVFLISLISVHYDSFAELQRREIDTPVGGHAIDIVLAASRSAGTICLFLLKRFYSSARYPDYKVAIICPVSLKILTVGDFRAEPYIDKY